MDSMILKNLVMLVLGLGIGCSQAYGAAFTNGSFESACNSPGGGYIGLPVGSTCMTGWTVVVKDIHYVGTYWETSHGSRSLDLDGVTGSAGGIQQTFSTTAGKVYLVSFDMAGNCENRPIIKKMRVSADGQRADFTFDCTGHSPSNMGWTRYTWSFVADDSTATLQFRSLTPQSTPPGWGPALDNVRVTGANVTCGGLNATLIGTPGLDFLTGTSGTDVIVGLGGDDTIYGLGGTDVICGGDGNDVLLGGDGNDRLFGGNGRDTLLGEANNDQLSGESGNDYLSGGSGDDTLNGGTNSDVCDGGPSVSGDTGNVSCESVLSIP